MQKYFSVSSQAFYDMSFEYKDIPDDLVAIDDHKHKQLLSWLNQGCYIFTDLTPSSPPPSIHHIFKDNEWVLGVEKSILQDEAWQAIKSKRHTVTRGGVYVKSVDKWFHTDDASRTQYLALQILPQLPPDLLWKTMDNSFVKLDKSLLNELAMTILQNEQINFTNAERHRLNMLQVDNPLEYDYSSGWTDIYNQGASND